MVDLSPILAQVGQLIEDEHQKEAKLSLASVPRSQQIPCPLREYTHGLDRRWRGVHRWNRDRILPRCPSRHSFCPCRCQSGTTNIRYLVCKLPWHRQDQQAQDLFRGAARRWSRRLIFIHRSITSSTRPGSPTGQKLLTQQGVLEKTWADRYFQRLRLQDRKTMCCGPSTVQDETRSGICRHLLAILPNDSFDILNPNREPPILNNYPKLND